MCIRDSPSSTALTPLLRDRSRRKARCTFFQVAQHDARQGTSQRYLSTTRYTCASAVPVPVLHACPRYLLPPPTTTLHPPPTSPAGLDLNPTEFGQTPKSPASPTFSPFFPPPIIAICTPAFLHPFAFPP
ncbi:hypothetical protein VFPFJ_07711 [Purpureocillium lilacinum]|uniref:Uncharacterized protein n=1 Tax=Purpureocillium lilacinum TaxID=33203 RepID=A0A179H5P3_PURLI|nr:hypothetical protein VFPFJ_07711 [Purpureocillium lilacinum]OAQ85322.1 hypothetical protein VFPFJ_07711 [Purpureocillium lilacinum]